MKVNAKALYLILGLLIGLGALAALRTIGNENNAGSNEKHTIGLPSMAPGGGPVKGNGDDSPYTSPPPTTLPAVSPVERHMSDVVITLEDLDSTYNRWLRGEDISEAHLISEERMAELREEALNQPVDRDMQHASRIGGPDAPTPGVGFASIDFNEGGGSVPPDPEMAAGTTHLIATVNVAVEYYDKSGTSVFGPTTAGSLFSISPCTSGLYDPNVIFDEEAERWVLAFDQGAYSTTGGYCMLVSHTADPTGTWDQYFFPMNSSSAWMDYPHAGVGDEYIVVGGNMFSLGGSFVDSRVWAFNKNDLYAGNPVTTVQNTVPGGASTPQPTNLHGFNTGTWPAHGNDHYILSDPFDGATYSVLRWDIAANSLTTIGSVNLGSAGFPLSVPQSGGSDLAGNDYRPLDFEFRNGYGWMTQTVSCNPGSGAVNCVRWAQIELTTATLGPAGSGTYGSNGEYRFFPDLAVNHCDDMAVGYSHSSSSSWPSVASTGRLNTDPVGTLQAETLVKAGEITYTAFDSPPRRWGDYTGMTIDPDGLTFWYLGEYSKDTGNTSGRWGTWINSFTYSSCYLDGDFTIGVLPIDQEICQGSLATYDVTLGDVGVWSDQVTLSTTGAPGSDSFVPSALTPPGNSTLTITGATAGSYTFDVIGSGGSGPTEHSVPVSLTVVGATPGAPSLTSPGNGASNVDAAPTYSWSPVAGNGTYEIEVATDSGFSNIVDSAVGISGDSYTGTMLAANTQYFWRVRTFNVCGPGTWAPVFSFTTVAISCQTFTATDVGQTITDSTPAMSSLVVGELTVTDVNAQVDIDHTYVGDLDIVLTAPGGASVTLLDRPGSPTSGNGCGDNNMSVLFDDESISGVDLENHCAGSDPWYVGDALPVAPLSIFDALQTAGTWSLTVTDNAGGDDGTIVGWSLEICFDSGPVLPDEIFQDGFETGDTGAWAEGGP